MELPGSILCHILLNDQQGIETWNIYKEVESRLQ